MAEQLQMRPDGEDPPMPDDEQEFVGEEQPVATADDPREHPDYEPEPPPPPVTASRHPSLEPRDPTEVLRDFDPRYATPSQQADALLAAGGKTDDSLSRAKRDIMQRRELATRCIVYREWPEEYRGKTIKGRVRQFKAPFTVSEVEEWVATYRGGGKYKIQTYDGVGGFDTSWVLEVEGDPKLPGEVEEAEAEALAASAPTHDHEARAALERQLQEERTERRMAEERARTDAMFANVTNALTSLAEAIKTKPEPAKGLDVGEAIAAASPLVVAFLETQQKRAEAAEKAAREDRKFMLEQQTAAEARTAELMKTLKPKQESLTDVLKGVESLKKLTAGGDDPAKMYHTLMKESVPILMQTVSRIQLHKAGITEGGDDEEFGAKMVLDRVAELAQGFISSRGGGEKSPAAGGAAGGAAASHPALPNTHGQYGPPAQLPTPPQSPRSGGAIVTPEEQAALEVAMASGVQHPVAPGGPMPQPAPNAVPSHVAPDINAEIFDRALQYMAQGKLGSDLAHDLMTEEEENANQNPGGTHLYLAPRIVQYICNSDPATVLSIINPHLQGRPQYHSLLDAVGQAFLADFCLYFSAPEEGSADSPGDDDAGDITGGATGEGATP